LSEEYIDIHSTLNIKCDKGHDYTSCFTVWKRGGRCRFCQHDKQRLSINFVKTEFEEEGYTLLSEEYEKSIGKLDFICPNGHIHYMTWSSWKSGGRCGVCAQNIKASLEYIRKAFNDEKYVLLEDNYINQKQKLHYICPVGHRRHITWSDWQQGYRCRICYFKRNSGEGNYGWKGGISFEPYSIDWKSSGIRHKIRMRDGDQCQNPECWNKGGWANQLSVHHIDYDKKNCEDNNLITLCRSCNSRANKNTNYHINLYRNILINKYGYVYN